MLVCCSFGVPTTCFYDYLTHKGMINRERVLQRRELRHLMKVAGLVSKQPGAHRYQIARSERPDIPDLLAREFDVQRPNQVWCGDITYVWAEECWHYLAAVLDLHTRRIVGWAMSDRPDAELAVKALELAWQLLG